MNDYIATFFSHFGAIRFKKNCEKSGFKAKVMPVPRDLSSSCGTCVRYSADNIWPDKAVKDEIEQIVCVKDGYEVLYRAEDI